MKQITNTDSSLLVLQRGEELHAALLSYARDTGLTSAWLSGLGGASNVTLGFYDIESKSYTWKEFDEPLEIISLTGNLSLVDNEPFWHIHGAFSGRDFQTVSGHVKAMTIGLTGELHITSLALSLHRDFDDTTGLKLL
jgi:predicted DNA-binding protein with PD1-like motif